MWESKISDQYVCNTTLLRAPWLVVNVINTRCLYIWVFSKIRWCMLSLYMMFFPFKWKRPLFGHLKDPI